MRNRLNYQTDLFNNPFDDINANKIDADRILDLWCTPFDNRLIKNIDEIKFRTQKLPIILQGFRGSGKTMILKYFSYAVQKERAKYSKNKSIYNQIVNEKSFGFYFVCEESFLKTFRQIFNIYGDSWVNIFEHYFELKFCKQIVLMLKDIFLENLEMEDNFFSEISIIKEEFTWLNGINSIDELLKYINSELVYIDHYKNDCIFSNENFNPTHVYDLYSLSGKLIEIIKISFEDLSDMTYLLLIDEFENLPMELQRFFNTIIKFSKAPISFRIGRRSEGIITTATINDTEYLRENHDYFLAKINIGDSNSQKKYFAEIAKKRLMHNSLFTESDQITDILGDMENLDEECLELCQGRDNHIKHILSSRKDINTDKMNEIIKIIAYPKNPIAESLNALWVVRNQKSDPVLAAKMTRKAMLDYFNGVLNKQSRKYKLDYSDKYRYSITCLLASVYKKKKQYYGFNSITHLADGNTRTFINICRTIISDALFYERDIFLEDKRVSKEIQNKAIYDFANSEFNSICSIISRGNNIRNLILNIGNIFSEYHRDRLLRYPETNQFVFNKLDLSAEVRDVIDIAESWSMIIKRNRTQRVSVSIDKKGDIYYINRAFCPIFGISYRIRGGFNVKFNRNELEIMLTSLDTINKLTNESKKSTIRINNQLSLFDTEGDSDE